MTVFDGVERDPGVGGPIPQDHIQVGTRHAYRVVETVHEPWLYRSVNP